jgi:hypothetical protein
MNEEIEFLKEQLKTVQEQIDYNNEQVLNSPDFDDRKWHLDLIDYDNRNKQYYINIINFLEKHNPEI